MQRMSMGIWRPLRQVTGWAWSEHGSAWVRLQGRSRSSAVVLWGRFVPPEPIERERLPRDWPRPPRGDPDRPARAVWPRPRLAAVWPDQRCAQGRLDPHRPGRGRPAWAEAQWEAAQALGLADDAVQLDVWPAQDPQAGQAWQWVAAGRADLQAFVQDLRGAGWRVLGVEPETWATRRAWAGLQGGLRTLQSLAVEDWRWDDAVPLPEPEGLEDGLTAHKARIAPRTWLMLSAWGAAMGNWS